MSLKVNPRYSDSVTSRTANVADFVIDGSLGSCASTSDVMAEMLIDVKFCGEDAHSLGSQGMEHCPAVWKCYLTPLRGYQGLRQLDD